jgi:hypothetical protein
MHDPLALPCAGTAYTHLMQSNFYRSLSPDSELIADYGFAAGKGWNLGSGFSYDTAEKHSGTQSLKCVQGGSTVSASPTRLVPVGMYCNITGSVWIKTTGLPGGTLTKFQYQIIKPDGSTIYQTIDAVTVTGNNNAWTQYTFTYAGDGNTGYLDFYCWLQTGGGSPSGQAWWDDISVKREVLASPRPLGF